MDLDFVAPNLRQLDEATEECLVLTAWEDERPPRQTAGLVDFRTMGRLSRLMQSDFFRGSLGESLLLSGRPRLVFARVLVLGAGKRPDFDRARLRELTSRIVTVLVDIGVRSAVAELPRAGAVGPTELAEETLRLEQMPDAPAIRWIETADVAVDVRQRVEAELLRQRRG